MTYRDLVRSAALSGAALLLVACPAEKKEAPPAPKPASKAAAASKPAEKPAMPELSVGKLVGEKNGIKLSMLAGSPKFPDAELSLKSPEMGAKVPAKATLEFAVKGYELGAQTTKDPMLANSGKGQHIHVIVDNAPYTAHYDPSAEIEMAKGSHVILAFLSRSHHESVKHDAVVTRVHVDKKTKAIEAADLSGPHMFYSRPKGTYTGEGAKKVLLDFFLVNTSIGEDGNKVEATINGETFMLTEWAPYVIEGAKMGELKIVLRLVDKDGKLVPGPFNKVERTVTLTES